MITKSDRLGWFLMLGAMHGAIVFDHYDLLSQWALAAMFLVGGIIFVAGGNGDKQ